MEKAPTFSFQFLLTLALCSGACYAALDLFFGAVQISGRDVIIAMLLAAMIASPALIVVAGLLRAVFFVVSIVPTRRHWVTILPGIMVAVVVSLAVAVLLDSDPEGQSKSH